MIEEPVDRFVVVEHQKELDKDRQTEIAIQLKTLTKKFQKRGECINEIIFLCNVSYVPCSFEHFSDESELTKVDDKPV